MRIRISHAAMALLVVVAGLSAGCPSFSSMQTARTVKPGENEFALGLQVFGFTGITTTTTTVNASGTEVTTEESDQSVYLPQFEFGIRHGINEDMDVGFKLYFLGAQADLKYRFLSSDALDAAVAPGMSAMAFGTGDASITLLYLHLPVFFDVKAGESMRLLVGPKLMQQVALGSAGGDTQSETALWLGGVVGLDLLLGETFRLRPEVNIYKSTHEDAEGLGFQGGLGFAF